MPDSLQSERIQRCYQIAREALLAERTEQGHWEGELSTSALSTATAVMALEMIRRQRETNPTSDPEPAEALRPFIQGGIRWLANHQNKDGGWGTPSKV